jgi:hypothetical protein
MTNANPFYAERKNGSPVSPATMLPALVYARLPLAPVNASPVPHLTSLYHFYRAGEYGNRSYPGNCGGRLIRDLLLFFRSKNAFDPMSGSGTCADVCRELGIPCLSRDIRHGFDATDPDCFRSLPAAATFDFVWAHPPYWRQKIYTDNPGDLSRTPTLPAFLDRYAAFIANCTAVLAPGGKFAILMGDYCDRVAGFVSLTYHTKQLAFAAGLRQCCTDIIRFSHGASSSRKVYRSSFIPGLHDVCMVFEKAPTRA